MCLFVDVVCIPVWIAVNTLGRRATKADPVYPIRRIQMHIAHTVQTMMIVTPAIDVARVPGALVLG